MEKEAGSFLIFKAKDQVFNSLKDTCVFFEQRGFFVVDNAHDSLLNQTVLSFLTPWLE